VLSGCVGVWAEVESFFDLTPNRPTPGPGLGCGRQRD
jgi:hypothetical protein